MDPLPRRRLAEFVQRFGPGIANDPARVQGMLLDAAPESRSEVQLLVAVAEEGIAARLARSSTSLFGEEGIDRAVTELQRARNLSRGAAEYAIACWTDALQLTSGAADDDVAADGATGPRSAPAPGPAPSPPPRADVPIYAPPPPRSDPAPPPYDPTPPDPPRRHTGVWLLLAALLVVVLAGGGVVAYLVSRNTPTSTPSPLTFPTTPTDVSTTPDTTPSDTSISVTFSDSLTSPETEEDVVITVEGQTVAELHPTTSSPEDQATVSFTRAGNYNYQLDATTQFVASDGTTQQASPTGSGSVALVDGGTYAVIIHSDGSLSLAQQ